MLESFDICGIVLPYIGLNGHDIVNFSLHLYQIDSHHSVQKLSNQSQPATHFVWGWALSDRRQSNASATTNITIISRHVVFFQTQEITTFTVRFVKFGDLPLKMGGDLREIRVAIRVYPDM